MTFNTSSAHNVMLMDVKLAAWGIDLSTASRVYFLEPVWQPAMERQAIKRAHRIGQTRPVHVETLIASSSLEETLLYRKKSITGDPNDCKRPEDDYQMKAAFMSARYVVDADVGADTKHSGWKIFSWCRLVMCSKN